MFLEILSADRQLATEIEYDMRRFEEEQLAATQPTPQVMFHQVEYRVYTQKSLCCQLIHAKNIMSIENKTVVLIQLNGFLVKTN